MTGRLVRVGEKIQSATGTMHLRDTLTGLCLQRSLIGYHVNFCQCSENYSPRRADRY